MWDMSMTPTSNLRDDLDVEGQSESERYRRIQQTQRRIKARKRTAETRIVTAQAAERMTRYMLIGVVAAGICTITTAAIVGYGIFIDQISMR
jgi:hypothetical protein